jgi:EPS-associated MarR family transcriptional regulator
MTQREMNRKMGVSLGKANYCLSKLTEKGMIKIERFKKASNRMRYAYRLTPSGFDELARLTLVFLKQRMAEYDAIKQDIKSLSEQAANMDLDRYRDSDLAPLLDKIEQNRKTDKE